jgi:recombination protein RecA
MKENKLTDEDMNEKKKRLDLILAKMDKQYGSGAAMRLGGQGEAWPSISTGVLSLDHALGIGGLPKGRVVEIYGPEAAGKSTVSMSVVASAQAEGGTCAIIDAEHALDPRYAHALGVDTDELIVSQPDYGEQGLNIANDFIQSGIVDLIVVDSVAALTPKAELEGEIGDQFMGLQSRMMSQAMRMMTASASRNGTCVIFINQLREKIGIMFGNPETTPGGRALKFYSSVRIDLRRKGDIKSKDGEFKGINVRATIRKNRMAPPFKTADFDILYGKGVDNIGCIVDMAIDAGIFKQSGSWITYKDETFAQGRNNARDMLASDLDLAEVIKKEVLTNG